MKQKLAYFLLDGKVLLESLNDIPNTTNTLPRDSEYFGLLLDNNSVWKGTMKIIIRADSLPEMKINITDDIPEIKPMWTKIK